jgi:GR25 family glycosyltransferase involved in LPS biosynthesis
LNKVIDKYIVINLKRSQERLLWITSQFEAIDTPFERFEAADGNELESDQLVASGFFEKAHRIESTRGNLGSCVSHITVLKNHVDMEGDVLGVFEDDITFNTGFHESFESKYADIPDDWDIIKLGVRDYHPSNTPRREERANDCPYLCKCYYGGLWAYLVKVSSIPKMVDAFTPLSPDHRGQFVGMDVIIGRAFRNHSLNVYAFKENIVRHTPPEDEISDRSVNNVKEV